MNEDFRNVITHVLSALLGGGLARLLEVVQNRRFSLIDQLRAERDKWRKECRHLRGQCEKHAEEVLHLKEAIVALEDQVTDLGQVPTYRLNSGWRERHDG